MSNTHAGSVTTLYLFDRLGWLGVTALYALTLCLPIVAVAHEVWIEPTAYVVETGTDFVADTKIGQNFKGTPQYYVEDTIISTGVADPEKVHALDRISGDIPAMKTPTERPGLHVAWMHTEPNKLHYKTFKKFKAFVTKQGLSEIADQHLAKGLPLEDFFEAFSRCSKALIMVGDRNHPAGEDSAKGMPIELVAQANPYQLEAGEPLPVLLLWQSKALADSQVMIFRKSPDDTLDVSTVQTDESGIALIDVMPGTYLLNAVNVIEWNGKPEAVWHSYWASMTFKIDEPQ